MLNDSLGLIYCLTEYTSWGNYIQSDSSGQSYASAPALASNPSSNSSSGGTVTFVVLPT